MPKEKERHIPMPMNWATAYSFPYPNQALVYLQHKYKGRNRNPKQGIDPEKRWIAIRKGKEERKSWYLQGKKTFRVCSPLPHLIVRVSDCRLQRCKICTVAHDQVELASLVRTRRIFQGCYYTYSCAIIS